MPSANRVVVTGLGMVSPLGNGRHENWRRLVAGEIATRPIRQFDARGWPVSIACEVDSFAMNPQALSRLGSTKLTRVQQFALQASFEALDDGAWRHEDTKNLGVIMGHGVGAIKPQNILDHLAKFDLNPEFKGLTPYLLELGEAPHLLRQNHPNQLTTMIAEQSGFRAFATSISTACAGGAQAIGHAARLIRAGRADAVLAGGADSLAGELLFAGFCLLGVLSKSTEPQQASRPFDRARDGLVASEGAAILLLESLDSAQKRGAKIYAEVLGYGESENAYRLTDLPEDGRGAAVAMRRALADTELGYVDCINAHGTSTEQNDRVEAVAIEDVFYQHGHRPAVTANKSQLGHLVAASGAIEAAISILTIKEQCIPAIKNLQQTDCAQRYPIDFVKDQPRATRVRQVLSNSFGFGGTNASLLFSEFKT